MTRRKVDINTITAVTLFRTSSMNKGNNDPEAMMRTTSNINLIKNASTFERKTIELDTSTIIGMPNTKDFVSAHTNIIHNW